MTIEALLKLVDAWIELEYGVDNRSLLDLKICYLDHKSNDSLETTRLLHQIFRTQCEE